MYNRINFSAFRSVDSIQELIWKKLLEVKNLKHKLWLYYCIFESGKVIIFKGEDIEKIANYLTSKKPKITDEKFFNILSDSQIEICKIVNKKQKLITYRLDFEGEIISYEDEWLEGNLYGTI